MCEAGVVPNPYWGRGREAAVGQQWNMHKLSKVRGKKKHENGNVQANVRANNSGNFEGTAHENVGFRGNKGQKVHPNFALNITMQFHYHAFCAHEKGRLQVASREYAFNFFLWRTSGHEVAVR